MGGCMAVAPVNVQVQTITASGLPVDNYEIYYTPTGEYQGTNSGLRLSLLSPAEEYVPPGHYFFWAAKGDLRGKITPVTVNHGAPRKKIHLIVPDPSAALKTP